MGHLAPPTLAFFTPKSGGSPNANEINTPLQDHAVIALIIFVAVEGALVYALVKFRARKGAVAAQIHGNTRLEIGWTLGAAVILVGLAIVTFVKLASIQDPPNSTPAGDQLGGESGAAVRERRPQAAPERQIAEHHGHRPAVHLAVHLPGRQRTATAWARPTPTRRWSCPPNTTVTLDIVSEDVVHSWWIPELGGKFQAVPGYHNYAWFKIAKPGLYRGQCAALCGRGHARMIATVKAVPPAAVRRLARLPEAS